MLTILMISRCPPYPLHLGDRLIVYHLGRELSALGVAIDLLAFAEQPSDWSLSEQQHYTTYFRDVMLFDAKPRPLPEMGRRALLPSARYPQRAEHAFAPEMWREIERRVATNAYDAVHLFGGVQVYEFAHALGGLPTVITPYESYSLYTRRALTQANGWRETLLARLNHMAARQFERWLFSPYDVVTVVSEPDRDELRDLNADLDVRVIPNGVAQPPPPMKPVARWTARVLFVGNYDYAPNADAAKWLAEAIFPAVRAQVPEAELWLVGNAPTAAMRELAGDSIDVTGRVPEVGDYYRQATVFVCPLRFGAGIKNKVLEALAYGCPVVATPLSVDGIAVVDGESVLLGETAEQLAAQVVRLLQDAELRERLAANGRRVVSEGYSWRSVAERYQAAYRAAGGR